jgi:RNA polymerase sigma factor (sigma-70 family)
MDSYQIQALIERCKQGDTRAFGILMTEFQPLVFRLAFRLLGNENQAKDMVQEVFIKIWLQINRYKSQYNFSTWIYKITCNLCYDTLRSMKHLPKLSHLPETIQTSANQFIKTEKQTVSVERVHYKTTTDDIAFIVKRKMEMKAKKQQLYSLIKE